jgi:WD40 repeat protein
LLPQFEDKLVALHPKGASIWEKTPSTFELSRNIELPNDTIPYTAAWNVHSTFQLVIVASGNLLIYDTRHPKCIPLHQVKFAHETCIRDIDCNPNRPHRWITAGDDGYLRFWDLREEPKKLAEYEAHSHWIWNARYNPFHDQLCLSCSSDTKVRLWNLTSLSSADSTDLHEKPRDTKAAENTIPEGLIHTYEQHEESVYSVAWSRTDPWTFASLSYDGRMVINRVPNPIKYKILLK